MEALLQPPVGGNESRVGEIYGTIIPLFVLVMVTLILRLIARCGMVRQFGWDDALITMAGVATIVSMSATIHGVKYGLGRHTYYQTTEDAKQSGIWTIINQLMLLLAGCMTKSSICLFTRRILTSDLQKRSLYSLVAIFVIVTTSQIIVLFVQCRPLETYWSHDPRGHCFSTDVFLDIAYFQGAFALATDLICTSLPIIVLWKVQMSLGKKLAIWTLMGIGLGSSACCIGRLIWTKTIANPFDTTWNLITVQNWTFLELYTAQIAANLPPLLSLYRYLHMRLHFCGRRRTMPTTIHSWGNDPLSDPSTPRFGKRSTRRSEFSRIMSDTKDHADDEDELVAFGLARNGVVDIEIGMVEADLRRSKSRSTGESISRSIDFPPREEGDPCVAIYPPPPPPPPPSQPPTPPAAVALATKQQHQKEMEEEQEDNGHVIRKTTSVVIANKDLPPLPPRISSKHHRYRYMRDLDPRAMDLERYGW